VFDNSQKPAKTLWKTEMPVFTRTSQTPLAIKNKSFDCRAEIGKSASRAGIFYGNYTATA